MLTMKHVASIFVPSTVNVDNAIDNKAIVSSVMKQLAGRFGGATSQECNGAYVSDAGELIVESVTRVFCYATEYRSLFDAVSQIASELCVEMSQECVLFDVDNVGYLSFGENN